MNGSTDQSSNCMITEVRKSKDIIVSHLQDVINIVATSPGKNVIGAFSDHDAREVDLLSVISSISIKKGTGQLYSYIWWWHTYKWICKVWQILITEDFLTRKPPCIDNSGMNVFLISVSVEGASNNTYSYLSCRVLVGKSLLLYRGERVSVCGFSCW